MPVALDPSQTFSTWLESDADKKPRPEFQFKALTIRERQSVYGLPESFKENETITEEEIVSKSIELFVSLCKGWTNMNGVEYTAESVRDVLTHGELWELLFSVAENSHVNHEEKKSSES